MVGKNAYGKTTSLIVHLQDSSFKNSENWQALYIALALSKCSNCIMHIFVSSYILIIFIGMNFVSIIGVKVFPNYA